MANKYIQLDPAQNVTPGSTAILDLGKFIGSVVEKITLNLGGTTFTPAMITQILIKANSKIIYETTGASLFASNQYINPNADPTQLKIDLFDRKAVTPNARTAGTWDLSVTGGTGITTLRAEITISGSAVAPTLQGFADLTPPTIDAAEAFLRGIMLRRHRATQVIGASGKFAINVPHFDPASGGSVFRNMFIYSSNLTAVQLVQEGVVMYDLSKAQNIAAQIDNGRNPQTGIWVMDFSLDGQMSQRVCDTLWSHGSKSAQILGTFSAGETISIETHELLPFSAY